MTRIALLSLLLLGGCSLTGDLRPGQSTDAQVVAQMGPPALALPGPGGGRQLYFTYWPWGTDIYVATIGADGVLRGIDQRLTYQNIHAVREGMTRDEVRRLLGPPYEVSRLPRQQREVWEYPWRHAVRERRVLFVQFSDDGRVREAIEMHDYERDPDNDSRR